MSLIPVQVELPQYSQSFSISVPVNSSVLDIKEEISRLGPGNPRVEGQRLIAQGRVLADTELIDQLWKSTDEARVVHLAVSPWSWTTALPERTSSSDTTSLSSSSASPTSSSVPSSTSAWQPTIPSLPPMTNFDFPRQRVLTLPFIHIIHQNALRALANQTTLEAEQLRQVTSLARDAATTYGITLPSVFSEDYPPADEGDLGAEYERVEIEGLHYLRLVEPAAVPTPKQLHAVKVLTYSFSLLSLQIRHPPGLNVPFVPAQLPNPNIPVDIHAIQQQLRALNNPAAGGAQARAAQHMRDLPVRALLTPLILLCLRTLLLFYFISPARKPLIGIMLGVWVAYEAWGALRGAIGDINDMARNADQQPRPARPQAAAGQPVADQRNPPVGGHAAGNSPQGRQAQTFGDILLNRLTLMNLSNEAEALYPAQGRRGREEPGVVEKARIFVSLMLVTLHPAVWNRRRAALKVREGRVRTEANAREPASATTESNGEGETVDSRIEQARAQMVATHERRPQWVKEYIERVRAGEWADE